MNNNKQKKILLVEDEPLISFYISTNLKDYGYDVLSVSSSQKALEISNSNITEIDLILMDIDLGSDIDGTETAKTILKDHNIPIIFLSSHNEKEIIEKTQCIPSYGYIDTDSNVMVLDASIKMALKLHDAFINIKQIKEELQSSEKRYRRLFESAQDGILILDAESGMIIDVNPFLIKMLGYSREDFLKKYIWDINAFKNIDYSKQLFQDIQIKKYVRYDNLPLETFDGIIKHVEFINNIYLVDGKKVIQCNIRDIAKQKENTKILTNDLDKNKSLLAEIQHRVKNSFSMISALISLRAASSESGEVKDTLHELSLRVKSISDLYLLLYETGSFHNVQLKKYCNRLIKSMISLSDNITINNDIEDITVISENGATFGMILVELLSNAIKYAFPDNQEGIINVKIKTVKSKTVLTIEDNGCGLPKDFNESNIKSLGLHLVKLMVSQLNGTIQFLTGRGTKIRIECSLQ